MTRLNRKKMMLYLNSKHYKLRRHKRPSNLSIPQYTNEFGKCLNMVKLYGTDMSDSVIAYREEENANLKQS